MLIGHGWYSRKAPNGFAFYRMPFHIYRFLCKSCRQTISLHPDFNHTNKRYSLNLVVFLLSLRFEQRRSRYAVCDLHDIDPRTLKRWERGFIENQHIKHICLFAKSHSPPSDRFAHHMLGHFKKNGTGDAVLGAAMAMTRLEHDFRCPLY